MDLGRVVYSREKGVSIPLLSVLIVFNLIPIAFIFSFIFFDGVIPLLLIFGSFMFLGSLSISIMAYRIVRGMDIRIHEDGIWIKTGIFFKQKGQSNPVEIHRRDMNRILLLNNNLHIYWKDPSDGKIKRSFVMLGRRNKNAKMDIYRTMNKRKGAMKWRGPKIHNMGSRKKEHFTRTNKIMIFLWIALLPSLFLASLFVLPMGLIGINVFFLVDLFVMFFLMFFFIFLLYLAPLRTKDVKVYKFHGDHFSVVGGEIGRFYTEYKFEDIESIEKAKAIPMVTPWNPWRYKFFRNQYSAKNSWEIYYIKFKDDYRLFEMGEYIKMKDKHPSKMREFQHMTIPAHIVEYFRKMGADI